MLTPLQEVASRIYAAMLSNPENANVSLQIVRFAAIEEAKALLEACKPEPLEFKSNEVNPYELSLINEKNLSIEEVVKLQNLSDAFFEGAKAYQQFINQ